MNPFTGRNLGARDNSTSSQNSQNRNNSSGREHQEEGQDTATYQSYGGFAERSAYGIGDYSSPAPPTPGSINPFVYDTRRSDGPPMRTAVDYNPEYADDYGARRPSFPASPEPPCAGTSRGHRSRFEDQELRNARHSHRKNALSALTGELPDPEPEIEPEPEFNRRQPSVWRSQQRHEDDIEMQNLQNVDLEAQPQRQPQIQNRRTNVRGRGTNNFWHSTANTAPERSCWQGFWANTRGDCIGITVAIIAVMMIVGIFIAVGVYYTYPGHVPAGE